MDIKYKEEGVEETPVEETPVESEGGDLSINVGEEVGTQDVGPGQA